MIKIIITALAFLTVSCTPKITQEINETVNEVAQEQQEEIEKDSIKTILLEDYEEITIEAIGMTLRHPASILPNIGKDYVVFNFPTPPAFEGDTSRGPIFLDIQYEPTFDPVKKASDAKAENDDCLERIEREEIFSGCEGGFFNEMEQVLKEEQEVLLNDEPLAEKTNPCFTPPAASEREPLLCESTEFSGKKALKLYYNHSLNDPGFLGESYVLYHNEYRIQISIYPRSMRIEALNEETGELLEGTDDHRDVAKTIVESIELKL